MCALHSYFWQILQALYRVSQLNRAQGAGQCRQCEPVRASSIKHFIFLTNATCRLACDNGPLPLDDAFANIIGKMYSIDLFNVAISEHILDAAVHNKDLNLFTLQYCKVTPDLGRVFEGHPTLNFLEWVSLSPPCSKFWLVSTQADCNWQRCRTCGFGGSPGQQATFAWNFAVRFPNQMFWLTKKY